MTDADRIAQLEAENATLREKVLTMSLQVKEALDNPDSVYWHQKAEQLRGTVEGLLQWRSVYPTKEGFWWHKGPSGIRMRRVIMAEIGYRAGLWPYDADTHEGLYAIDGEWAGPILPPEAALGAGEQGGGK